MTANEIAAAWEAMRKNEMAQWQLWYQEQNYQKQLLAARRQAWGNNQTDPAYTCACGQPVEYEATGRCLDCHSLLFEADSYRHVDEYEDYRLTVQDASWKGQ